MKGKALVESLFLIFFSLLIFVAGMGVAVVAPLAVLTVPAIFMILERRLGARVALLGVCFGSSVVLVLVGPASALLYMIAMGLLGVSFGLLAGRSESGADFLLMATTVSVTVKVMLLLLFFSVTGINLFYISPETSERMAAEIAGMLSGGGLNLSNGAMLSYAREVVNSMTMRMPAMLIIFSVLDTFISYQAALKITKRFGGDKMISLPPFGLWKFPRNVFVAFLAAVLADTAKRIYPDNLAFEMIAVNILELLRALFLIEGLAVCWYYMTALGVNKILKTAVTVFCVFFWPIPLILSSIGFFDMWLDLRRDYRRK